ncbi:hypothetical protein IC802_07320 [Geobacillus sp. 44C]|nr:hypothetical protein IC802_07320 [Geobacillus sp. 44C]
MMLAHRLAEIHSNFGIYSESQINGNVDFHIVSDLKQVPELNYLVDFYEEYFQHYKKAMDPSRNYWSFKRDNIARSVDLPFIGRKVVERGKAEYIFVFKGSLQKEEKLSMTVLSCFWIFEDVQPYQSFFDRYWPNTKNYDPLVRNLGITRDIAERSYVTDFARVANHRGIRDMKKCKELLMDEIHLLNPQLVILVGSEPRDAFSHELRLHPEKYMSVPFSLKGVPKKTQIEGPLLYKQLRERLYHLLDKEKGQVL